jgi:hypothetical protein
MATGGAVTKVDSARPAHEFGIGRTCRAPGCETKLSRYNPDEYCSVHASMRFEMLPKRR